MGLEIRLKLVRDDISTRGLVVWGVGGERRYKTGGQVQKRMEMTEAVKSRGENGGGHD